MLQETVIFRSTDELAVAISQAARAAGITVSEYLRRISMAATGSSLPAEPEWVY